MTPLLEQAIRAVRERAEAEQDRMARLLLEEIRRVELEKGKRSSPHGTG